MEFQYIALSNTQILMDQNRLFAEQIGILKAELVKKDLLIAQLTSLGAENNVLPQQGYCDTPLEQPQQYIQPLSFALFVPIEAPPSSTSTLGTATPSGPSMVQSLDESDFRKALSCIFWSTIMSGLIPMRQHHDLKYGAAMARSKLGCRVGVEVWIFKLQQYKVVILLLCEGSYRPKDKVL